MIAIDIEVKNHNMIKDFFHKQNSKLEDVLFSIVLKMPEKFIPKFMLIWLDKYTTKRINQLRQQNIKQTWQNMYLKDAASELSNRQQQ